MNPRVKVPRVNRAKLVAMGRDKIHTACSRHVAAMGFFEPTDRRYRLHEGLLAQCFMAFKESAHR